MKYSKPRQVSDLPLGDIHVEADETTDKKSTVGPLDAPYTNDDEQSLQWALLPEQFQGGYSLPSAESESPVSLFESLHNMSLNMEAFGNRLEFHLGEEDHNGDVNDAYKSIGFNTDLQNEQLSTHDSGVDWNNVMGSPDS